MNAEEATAMQTTLIKDDWDVDKKKQQKQDNVDGILKGIYALMAGAKKNSLSFQKACESLNKRWASVEKRWNAVERRWDSVEKQWDAVKKWWDSVKRQYDKFKKLNRICKAKAEWIEKQADGLLEDYKELNVHSEKYHIDLLVAIIANDEAY